MYGFLCRTSICIKDWDCQCWSNSSKHPVVRSNNSCHLRSRCCVHDETPQHQWKVYRGHLQTVLLLSRIVRFIRSLLSNCWGTIKSSIVKDVTSKTNYQLTSRLRVATQFISKLLTSIALIDVLSAFLQNKLLVLVKTLHRRSSNRSQLHTVSTQTCFIGWFKQNTPGYWLYCFETVSYSGLRKTSLEDGEYFKNNITHIRNIGVRFGEEKYHAICQLESHQLSKHWRLGRLQVVIKSDLKWEKGRNSFD